MKSPGVTVRPIITIDGSHEVNDVFLEDVRVPVENLIGEENKGWTYAKFLLGNERTSMAGIGRSTRYLDRLKKIVKAEIPADDPAHLEFVKEIARVELDVLALEATELRVVAQMARGIDPGPAASLFKIRGTEIFQRHHRADASRDRQLRPGDPRASGERQSLHARSGLRPHRVRKISQFAQAQHLRRIERDPAQHHRQGGARSLTHERHEHGYPVH